MGIAERLRGADRRYSERAGLSAQANAHLWWLYLLPGVFAVGFVVGVLVEKALDAGIVLLGVVAPAVFLSLLLTWAHRRRSDD